MITPIVPSHATPVEDAAGSDPPALRLALLSGFELRGAGHRIDLPLSSQRVVAFLALQEHPVQRVYVAGNLWIDSSEERASSCLRTALWRMRQPDCEIVASTSTHLGLARELHVDLRDCRDRARRIVSGSAGSQRDDVDGLALAGDVLPDWYDDWVLLERERFRQLRLHALEALCQELAGRGCFAQAAEAGLAAVEVEPLRESAHRVLVEMYLAEGNPCEAIRQYRFYRDLLWRELQLEPSPMMCDLMGGLPVA